MRKHFTTLRTRLAARARAAKADDRGSILSEYSILTGVIAVAAVAATTYIVANIQGWLDSIPAVGG
jgi:Flp pilus assembly pilin Flp